MDEKGHWHTETPEMIQKFRDMERSREHAKENAPQRPVISIEIGEMVCVVKNGGDFLMATFDATDKNKVTLTPKGDGPHPYMELAEHVQLRRANGEHVRAQVWDNRKGKLILRTLPI